MAGIVIGIAILTALLAIAGTWFLLRTRWSKDPENVALIAVKPRTEHRVAETGGIALAVKLEDYLHQQADHGTIKSTIETLRDLIKQYAENYIRTESVKDPDSCRSSLESIIDKFFGKNGIEQPSVLANLLVSPRTRQDAMRYVMALTFLSATESSSNVAYSLLPTEVMKLIRTFPEQRSFQGSNCFPNT